MIIKGLKLSKIMPVIAVLLMSFSAISVLEPQKTQAVSAGDWKPGRIIDDAVFFNKDSMTVGQIQDFLNARVPNCDRWNPTTFSYAGKPYAPPYTCLKEYQENPNTHENNIGRFNANGTPYNVPGGQSAAQIIWDAAQAYNINPQSLIVLLQKETAIVTDTWSAGWQYDRAMGYGCPDNGPGGTANCNASYYGFYNQVGNAAWQLRRYVTYPDQYNFKAGVTRNILWQVGNVCGSAPVYIENSATAALYNYTPYQPNQAALNNLYGTGNSCSAYGNRNFWRLFNDWFGETYTKIPYAWQHISQSAYADASRTKLMTGETTATPGSTIYLRVRAKNIGNQIWYKNQLNLGTSKTNDRSSLFYSNSWNNGSRPATINEDLVTPGNIGTFDFALTAPGVNGTYLEYFNLVAEGVTWLNDRGLHYSVNVVSRVNENQQLTMLTSGQSLESGNNLMSSDRKSVLQMQSDGNLVLYNDFTNPVWYTNTANTKASKLVMQPDGNLVLYNANNTPLWNTETFGNPGSKLVMQPDGNLVLYNANNTPLWATYSLHYPDFQAYVNTWLPEGKMIPGQYLENATRTHKLVLQTDGNLVLYKNNIPLWASGTDGYPIKFLALQPDGNLVLYDTNKKPLWYSRTSGTGDNNRLILQQDGNLVLYNKHMTPLWNTATQNK